MHRRTLLTLMGAAALQGCVPAAPVARAAPDPFEGGIGGTGIIGTLTDFGSLMLINGLAVEFDPRAPIAMSFGSGGPETLAPGQTLTVTAQSDGQRLVARTVRIDHALIGQLEQVGGQYLVNGVILRPEGGAIIAASPGSRVAVSGIWREGGLSTTRIDPTSETEDLVAGTGDQTGPTQLSIGGLEIETTQPRPASGTYLVARGRHIGGRLRATAVQEGRFSAGTRLDQLSVEGYLEPTTTAPSYRIAGLGHSFGPEISLAPLARQRALYFGPYDGFFQARVGYVIPNSFARRRALLKNGIARGLRRVPTSG